MSAVAFSPDGKRLATASDDKTARLWDLKSGRELLVFRGHSSFIYGVAFSPDGSRLVTAGQDGTAKIWDASTAEELVTFIARSGAFLCAAFSPDGKRLATGGTDALVQLYALDIKDLLKLARQRITRPFTSEECRLYFSGEACPVHPRSE